MAQEVSETFSRWSPTGLPPPPFDLHDWNRVSGGSAIDEHPFTGGRIDVYCRSYRVAVECGSLSARRLTDLIEQDEFAARVLLVPLTAPAYEGWLERDEHPPLPFIEVKRSGEWRKTLADLREERHQALVAQRQLKQGYRAD